MLWIKRPYHSSAPFKNLAGCHEVKPGAHEVGNVVGDRRLRLRWVIAEIQKPVLTDGAKHLHIFGLHNYGVRF
jgi:hypothetical protein